MRQAGLGTIVTLAMLLGSMPGAMAYTAVVISDDRAFGYCSNQQSIGAATDCAMQYCQESAPDPHTCAIAMQSEPAGHYSLAIGGGAWGVASGETEVEADADALLYCKASNCQIVARWTEGVVRGQ